MICATASIGSHWYLETRVLLIVDVASIAPGLTREARWVPVADESPFLL